MNPGTTLPAGPAAARRTARTRTIVVFGLVLLALLPVVFLYRGMFLMAAPACLAGRWRGCLGTENGVVLMTIVLLPVSALLTWGLAGIRRAAGVRDAWRRSVAEVGIVHGTVPWLWLTMMPGPGAGTVPGRLSLVPLRDLLHMPLLGIGGNLLVLAALGFFAPVRSAAMASVPRLLALGLGCSVLIETLQYVLRLDRVSSVDDVLVNTVGCVLAGLASRPWWRPAK